MIHNQYRTIASSAIYIDAGNEEYGGQVVFSTRRIMTQTGYWINLGGGYRTPIIKDIVEHFELDDNDRHPSDLSCAERAISAPQNIGTNIMASNIMFDYCNWLIASSVNYFNSDDRNEILNREGSREERIKTAKAFINRAPTILSHIIYFNSKTGITSSAPFSEEVQEYIGRFENNSYF